MQTIYQLDDSAFFRTQSYITELCFVYGKTFLTNTKQYNNYIFNLALLWTFVSKGPSAGLLSTRLLHYKNILSDYYGDSL